MQLKKCVMKDSHLAIEVWTMKDKPGFFPIVATSPGEYLLIDIPFNSVELAKGAAINEIAKAISAAIQKDYEEKHK